MYIVFLYQSSENVTVCTSILQMVKLRINDSLEVTQPVRNFRTSFVALCTMATQHGFRTLRPPDSEG
jgi:hypothetical protein